MAARRVSWLPELGFHLGIELGFELGFKLIFEWNPQIYIIQYVGVRILMKLKIGFLQNKAFWKRMKVCFIVC